MNLQSQTSSGGLLSNAWVQFAVLAVVVLIVIALAAKYIW